jgi:murein DD-endopeptidase MepM/ murein hydrolase activator NlpD
MPDWRVIRKRQQEFPTLQPEPAGWFQATFLRKTFPRQGRSRIKAFGVISLMVAFLTSGDWTRATAGSEELPLMAAASGSVGNSQSRQMLKVSERRDGNVIHFLVENLEAAEVTATFDLRLVNLRGSASFPFTTTLSPHQKLEAFSLTPIEEGREWHFSLTNAYTLGSSRAVHDDRFVYSLPYAAGQAFRVSQADDGAFSHSGPEQHAIDWRMPEGTPVLAARGGVVVGTKADSDAGGADRSFENNANYILIQHNDGTIGNYAHLLKHGVRVRVGQKVATGALIGLSGNTGFSSGPHLHFSVFKTRDGRERESIAIRFRTEDRAAAKLVSGKVYKALPTRLAAKQEPAGKGAE